MFRPYSCVETLIAPVNINMNSVGLLMLFSVIARRKIAGFQALFLSRDSENTLRRHDNEWVVVVFNIMIIGQGTYGGSI